MKQRISRNRAKYAEGERKVSRTRYFYLPITFSAAFSLLFLSRYSLIAFPRVCPFLVTFLKLITSALSASFVSFRRGGPSASRHYRFTFSRLLQRFFRSSRQTASLLPSPFHFLPSRSQVLSFLIPQDLAASSKTFFPSSRPLLYSFQFTRYRGTSMQLAQFRWTQPAGRTSAFDRISHFPRGYREIGRGSLPITHCPLQLKLPDRARASVGCPPIDSTFLRRSMLICSLFLLFVRGNRRLRNRYRTGPYRAEHDTNFVRFLDNGRKGINTNRYGKLTTFIIERLHFLNYTHEFITRFRQLIEMLNVKIAHRRNACQFLQGLILIL